MKVVFRRYIFCECCGKPGAWVDKVEADHPHGNPVGLCRKCCDIDQEEIKRMLKEDR